MTGDMAGKPALAIEDLPRLLAAVADIEPDRVALSDGDTRIGYARLRDEIATLDTAMGGALGFDALFPVVLSNIAPALLGAPGLAGVVDTLLADAVEVLGDDAAAPATVDPGTLAARFDAQVARTPDAVALEFDGQGLTYREFDARVNRLARHLIGLGVGPDARVGLAVRRSFDLLVGMYAIVKAGGAYVPLDPDHPADRLAYVLEIAEPVAVVTTERDAVDLPGSVPALTIDTLELSEISGDPIAPEERRGALTADHLAYVIFTSGSTGRPKGVAVEHRAIVANIDWRQAEYGMRADDVVLQKTPFTFDVSVWEFFWPLQVGARLTIAVPDGHRDPAYLAQTMIERGVTIAHFVPSMLAVYLAEPTAASVSTLRYVFASGEALPPQTVARFYEISSARLHNLYGPTEAAVDVTYFATSADDTVVPIGAAVADTGLYVLDEGLRPVPDGVEGELYLAGVQLARGYLRRPDLTSDRFVADPFGEPGDRMYRTGDLVKTNEDGQIEYIGRTDFQVKLRGLRIELGEIESALLDHPGVRQSVVVVHSDPALGDHLVAYLVTDGRDIERSELADAVRRRLPDYMVPSLFVELDEFPLGGSGKLDRKALPAPDFSSLQREYRAPSTATEHAVVSAFEQILGIERLGVDDDFFELGGNSLSATRVVARLGSDHKVRIDVREFFDAPTAAELASLVDAAMASGGDGRAPLVPQVRPELVPLSLAQQRMWFLNRFEPESAVDNIPVAIRLSGALDAAALQAAVADVLGRHESLRTVYPDVDGVGYQQVLPVDEVVPDLTPVPVAESDLIARATEIVGTGFDVTSQVPFRARLFAVSDTEHVLVLVVHHIASDGFSMGPLTRDVVTAYAARVSGDAPQWEPLAVQYADFAIWQREVLGSEDDPESVISSQVAFWRERLAGLPEQLDLPADRPRPAVASYRGASHRFVLRSELRSAVRDLARRTSTTEFMVVHAALAVLLARLSGTDDIAIGTPVAGRGDAALDDLVGMFVNTLVLRTRVDSGESFEQVLGQVRGADLEAFGHADLPFERLVELIDPERSTARHPLFQVLLAFQNLDADSLELPGLTVSALDVDAALAKFDLQVTVSDDATAEGYLVDLTYATDLFDARTMESFAERLTRILTAVATEPALPVGDVALLDDAERTDVLATWNATEHELGDARTLADLFAEQVRRSPDAVAVEFEGESLTYGDFAERVNRLARHLISLGVGPETSAGLAMRRSPDLLVGMYAVVAAGGAYVPIDPDQPDDRNGYILDTAAPVVVLTTERDGYRVPATASATSLAIDSLDLAATPAEPITDADRIAPLRPSNTAYTIFTSGSTGRPKGVAVAHASVVNQIRWITTAYGIGPDDVVLQKTPFTFDVSVWELFGTLTVGARMVIAAPDGHRDTAYLGTVIRERAVTITSFVPSMLAVFAASVSPDDCASLRTVLVAGEAFPLSVAEQFSRISAAELHNLYGPTEATVHATARPVAGTTGGSVAMGAPVWNTRAYVLDARLSPVPAGVVGELYLAGAQVARGYVGRPDLTAERFVASPFGDGERLYRTGDLVRRRNDHSGDLEYLGRTDFQVKLRGLRIELGEIETALLDHTGVSQAAAQVRHEQLVAYVVPAPNTTFDRDAAQAALSTVLPAYMVPSQFMVLDEMPLGSSGKVDRKALPDPVFETRGFRAPTTPVEEVVAGVFAGVLGVDRVGLDDDFFALGGNSLIATQVVARLGSELGTVVPVRVLFEAPGVAALAARVEQSDAQGRTPLVVQERPERVPLSLAQQRMWFLNRFEPESAVNNIPVAVRLTGALDVEALRSAVADVLGRHESLRTIYPDVDGVGYQQVLPVSEVEPDLSPIDVTETQLVQSITDLVSSGFDVSTQAPFRAQLFAVSATEHVLALVVHHIAADGFSMGPLTRDIVSAYAARAAGGEPGWEPLPVQYADFAIWQREVLGSEDDPESVISSQVGFWRQTLAGLPEQLDLPADHPRPAVATNRGALYEFTLDETLHDRIVTLARERNATPFMVVHAALAVLLARLSGTDDIAIGTPVAGRGDAALDDLVGMFVNTLVLRTRVDGGESFEQVLGRVRGADLEAFGHADLPFERLVEVLNPERSTARHPLFQVMLSFQNLETGTLELPRLTVGAVDLDITTAKFDLQFVVTETPTASGAAEYSVGLTYAIDLFDARTVERVADRFVRLLDAVTGDLSITVGDVDLLDDAERVHLLERWNDTDRVLDGTSTLVDLFAEQVRRSPDAVAVEFEGESSTYGDFSERVNRLARHLISLGVGPDARVGLAMRRSLDLLVGMYAVVVAGGAYVPIDPDQPDERNGYILDTAAPVVVLTTARDGFRVPGERSVPSLLVDSLDLSATSAEPVTDAERTSPLRASNTAYVIFTSGSTGRPKGVAVPHGAIVNRLRWMQHEYPLTEADRVLQKTPFTFDVSVWEFFWPLQIGARLVVAVPDGHRDPRYLASVIDRRAVTVVHFVPSMLAVFVAEASVDELTSLRHVFASGEALPPALAARTRALLTDAGLHNLYGPTEAAVDVTYHEATDADTVSVPIGAPVWNTRVYVLDERLAPVPVGVAGELYLAGVQLARGYVQRPDLTAERFVASPFGDGERLYRTGDLVRRPDETGELDYIGRTDFQVKLRGLRIELGEIETALLDLDEVDQAVVLVRQDQLVAYVVPQPGATFDQAVAGAALSAQLPAYMVPATYVLLDAMPLGASGKLDRKALPDPVFEVRAFRAPTTSTEQVVASTYSEVLGVDRVGLDDDFFALGGNSLIATRVVSRIGAALNATVPLRLLFEAATVEDLAARLEHGVSGGPRRPLVAGERPDRVPLSLAQQRYWFLNQFDTASSAVDNIPIAVRLVGDLDVDALRAAARDVIARHESLRTIYPDSPDGPHQVVLPLDGALPELVVRDVAEAELEPEIVAFMSTTFDVTAEVPVAVRIFRVSDDEHILALVVHHVSADGASVGPLTRDLMTAYVARSRGDAPAWEPLPVQYADYALWQREVLGREDDPESLAAKQVAYWKQALAGLPDQLDLPSDRQRPPSQSFRGESLQFTISPELHRGLQELARSKNATLFMVVNAAFATVLARLSGTRDIAIGTPIAGRGERELDDLIGMFVNTLVFRSDVDPAQSFERLLEGTRETDLGAFANADVPFERLVEVLNPVRSTARNPLFQVGLSFQNLARTQLELPGLTVSSTDFELQLAKTDLQLTVFDHYDDDGAPDVIDATFTYATDLFDESTVAGFAQRFVRVLEAIVTDPATAVGDIDMLDGSERVEILESWNATDRAVEQTSTLVDLFDEQVSRVPDAAALVFEGESLTYAEFDARVNRLARRLISEGVGPESTVALAMRRSVELLVGMYAVAKAGGAYVPVDPDQPDERNAYILDAAAPVVVLSTERDDFVVPGERSVPSLAIDTLDLSDVSDASIADGERVAPLRASNTAYVIFTSGSTGRPKGVAVPHAAIVNQLLWKREYFGLGVDDAVLLKTVATFDLSVWEFWSALVSGGRVVIASADGHRDPAYLNRLLTERAVTTLHVVPSMLEALMVDADGVLAPSLRHILAIGEALPPATAQRFLTHNRARLVNLYGPTEAAVSVTAGDVTDTSGASVPIGVPEWNTRVYVLDERLHPVPAGVAGELYLAGAQLARGYFGRADLSAERFVASPFGDGERLYRTGDLVRWTRDGQLDYLSRTDFQVKVRGFRIELGEIESALRAMDALRDVAVIAREDERVGTQLVAYVVPAEAEALDVATVRSDLAKRVPSYMVPSAFVTLDALPLNVNGKLDRRALPEPIFETREFRTPVSPAEQAVAAVFAEVLGVEQVGLDDDFFELGGNSLLATQVASRLGAALGAKVPVRALFENTAVESLAGAVESQRGEDRRPLEAVERPTRIPLSLAQQRMWFLNRFDTESSAYNVPIAIRLTGDLDVGALQAAVGDVVARHESLRTFYPETEDGPVQVIVPAAQAVPDLTPVDVAETDIVTAVQELAATIFDVTTAVPLSARLFRVRESDYVLAFVVHHISADGSSMGPLTRDLMTAYVARSQGDAPAWEPLSVQYADFAIWQREVLGDEDDPEALAAKQVEYWKQALAGLPDQLDLPSDRPRPAVQSFRGGRVDFTVEAELHRRLADLGRRTNTTMFMVLHTALAVFLARMSSSDDIAIGTPMAGRGERELDDLIGMFVNTLVFRTHVDSDASFTELLGRTREADLGAFANADVPFERLVEVLNPARSTARHPLFQVGLSFQNLAQAALELPGLTISGLDTDMEISQFDLHLIVTDRYSGDGTPTGITGYFTYATDLFDESTVAEFAARFIRVLDAVVDDPALPVGDLPILDTAETTRVLEAWNDTTHPTGSATLVDLFDEQVSRVPDAAALVFEGGSLTYAEFDARVNRLARRLISEGVGPESTVALAMRRSVELLVGMYAVAKAGGAYVPVDPDQPDERNAYILDTAAPVVILSTERDEFTAPGEKSVPTLFLDSLDLSELSAAPVTDTERIAPLRATNTAYVIFTSGSTGRPKGVAVPHAAIVNQLLWKRKHFGLGVDDAVLLKTVATFDLSVWEFWSALVSGGRVVIASADGHRDPAYLNRLLTEQSVTTLHVVPSMLEALMVDADGVLAPSLRHILAIGEALPPATAQRFLTHNRARLVNLYGPTEAAVSVTAGDVTDTSGASVPIGVPEWNTRVYVLDERLHPVPAGVAGELYLAGAQLARGYFGRADLSAERFVASPFGDGERLYRTGDLVRWTRDGQLDYLSRTDFQVKVRGFRIELGEIESALRAMDALRDVAVIAREGERVGTQLVAYVVPADGAQADIESIRSALGARVPSYMVPSAFVTLDALPLNVNGKLDRKALPEPVFETREFRAPSTPIEEIVAGVFADVLGLSRVGVDDDFFELGGNSLLATQVVSRIGAALDTRVPVRVLFEAPSVAALAVAAEQHTGAAARPALVPQPRPDRVPLSLAQQRMWFLNRFDTESSVDNIPVAVRLSGALDLGALQAAVQDLLARHEVLRTIYPEIDGQPYQLILPVSQAAPDIDVEPVTEDDLLHKVTGVVSRGFDVTTEIPLRARLFELSERDHVLVFVVHHISADGWSISPLTRDVMTAYMSRAEGEAPGWAPLPVQYADFAIWQRAVLGGEDDAESLLAAQAEYWKRTLAGLPDELNLPMDRPRPSIQSFTGGKIEFVLGADLHRGLAALARSTGTTMFMVMHTALAVFLSRISDSDDIAIGTPIAGRGESEVDDLVGMFVNTLVLRTRVDAGKSFSDLLSRVREGDLEAFAHADIPFERLVEILNPERSTARHPLFQVALSFENLPETALELPELTVSGVPFEVDTVKFDLSLTLREHRGGSDVPAGISAEFSYASALFDRSTIEGFARRFEMLVAGVLGDPHLPVGDLPLLDTDEFDRLTHVHGDRVSAGGSLTDIFTSGVARAPEAVAVRYEGRSVTYRELDETSSRLARMLIERGVGPEDIVAVAYPRSYEMVLSVWAIAKAGAAHLPVDPNYPIDRVRYMLADSGAAMGITGSEYREAMPDDSDWVVLDAPETAAELDARSGAPVTDADRVRPIRLEHPAYVIYTSGSTGRPKGVVVTHTGLGGVVDTAVDLYHLRAGHRFLHICSPSFDPSVLEWMAAFSSGATLVIVPGRIIGGPDLAELLQTEQVTHTIITPAVLGTMDPAGIDSLEVMSVGGDVTTPELLGRWAPGRKYFNGYGPTETTIISSFARLQPGRPITIGNPTHGVSALVLDARLNPVPEGVAGELYMAGGALARGYHGRTALTAERFVANPYSSDGSRMYRTGDVVRWRSLEGGPVELEFVGRSDFQVKVRGFRIELGEIDAALAGHDSVDFAATLGRTTGSGATVLVSYVLPVRGRTVDTAELTEFVARSLPPHMVPSAIVVLDEVPLTPVGKLDRDALPEPVIEEREYRAAEGEVEQIISEVFAEVLHLDKVSVDESFFALGGDSIVSIQLVSRAKARGVVFTPRDVFERRSVAGLAEVATRSEGGTTLRPAELPGGGVGEVPLTPIMHEVLSWPGGFDRFSQIVAVTLPRGIDQDVLVRTIGAVVDHHDALRSILERGTDGEHVLRVRAAGSVDPVSILERVELPAGISDADLTVVAEREIDAALGRLDPASGSVLRFVWFDFGGERAGILAVVAHHLVVDGVSWRILLPDLGLAWGQIVSGQEVSLDAVGTSLRRWAHGLVAAASERRAELPLWERILEGPDPALGSRPFDPAVDTVSTVRRIELSLPASETDALLTSVPTLFRGGVADGLMAALGLALVRWRRDRGIESSSALVEFEGHGREESVLPGADLSRTVGWFTSAYPVRVDLTGVDVDEAFAGGAAIGSAVKAVKEQLLAIPDKGMGFGLLRYLDPESSARLASIARVPQVSFNYLGRMSSADVPEGLAEIGWAPTSALGELDVAQDADMPANASVDINAIVSDGDGGPQLGASIAFPSGLLDSDDVDELAQHWSQALSALAQYAASPDAGGLTPSDLLLAGLEQSEIEEWEQRYPALSDVWPLSPLQAGLLFHASMVTEEHVDVYTMQAVLDLEGEVDPARLRAAGQALLDRYPNLRTAFVTDAEGRSLQLVLDDVELPWRELDSSDTEDERRMAAVASALADEQSRRFDMESAPLIRFLLVRSGTNRYHLGVTTHHILLDGWSMPLLMQDLMALYVLRGDPTALPRARSYRSFLAWLAEQDRTVSLDAWATALEGLGDPTAIAPVQRDPGNDTISTVRVLLDTERTARLTALAADLGVTVNTLVQAAWGVVLGRITGSSDVVFGATVSGRPADLPGVESMVGLFINTLPVRVRTNRHESASQMLRRLQAEQAGLLDHHYVGLSDIEQRIGTPIGFDSLLVFESYPIDRDALSDAAGSIDGMTITGVGVKDATHYPITLLTVADSEIELTFKYLERFFDEAEVVHLSRRFVRVLEAFVEDSDTAVADIELVEADELARIVAESGPSAVVAGTGAGTLATVLAEVVEVDPSAPSLAVPAEPEADGQGVEISYRELDERSSRLARMLIDRGLGTGDAVAVSMPRSVDSVVAQWAVAKTGAALVMVDPARHGEELPAGAAVGLTLSKAAGSLSGDWIVVDDEKVQTDLSALSAAPVTYSDRLRPVEPSDAAAVIGSRTFTNAELLERIDELRERYELTYESRSAALGSVDVESVALEPLTVTATGAVVVVVPEKTVSGTSLDGVLYNEWVTHVHLPEASLRTLEPGSLEDLAVVVVVDEVPQDLLDEWGAAHRVHRLSDPD
ncbi:non-ribosomal peptide synthase/polyketide synthase [Rhodococcus gordoniae]